jgi:hypothetical protein
MNIEPSLDERALRWPDEFREGTPILLNDGQPWHFPSLTVGDTDLLNLIAETPTRGGRMGPLFELAYRLLTRNYNLTREQVRILFPYHPADWTTPEQRGVGPSPAVLAAGSNQAPDGRTRLEQIIDDFRLHLAKGA